MDTETICTLIGFAAVIVMLCHFDHWPDCLHV